MGEYQFSIFFLFFILKLFYTPYFPLPCLFHAVLYSPSWWIPQRCTVLKYAVINYDSHLRDTPNLETIAPIKPTPDKPAVDRNK